MQRDLVRCGIKQDWRELAKDKSQSDMEMHIDTINKEAVQKEDRKKDERKRTQQSCLTGWVHL